MKKKKPKKPKDLIKSWIDEKFVGENDKFKFYQNSFCKDYKGYGILLTEDKKTKRRMYIVTDKNIPVYDSQQIESIYIHIDLLVFANKK